MSGYFKFFLLIITFSLKLFSQAYQIGDLSFAANYGAPKITPFVFKTIVTTYYNSAYADKSFNVGVVIYGPACG